MRLPGKVTFAAHAGDVLTIATPGGGGHGDPMRAKFWASVLTGEPLSSSERRRRTRRGRGRRCSVDMGRWILVAALALVPVAGHAEKTKQTRASRPRPASTR